MRSFSVLVCLCRTIVTAAWCEDNDTCTSLSCRFSSSRLRVHVENREELHVSKNVLAPKLPPPLLSKPPNGVDGVNKTNKQKLVHHVNDFRITHTTNIFNGS